MRILTVTESEYGENCYVLSDGRNAYVIDPGIDREGVKRALKEIGLPLKYVFLTHGHYDHTYSLDDFDGSIAYAHEDEKKLMENPELNLSAYSGRPFAFDSINYFGGERHSIGGFEFIHTPGHTRGCVVIKIENSLFSGDTLFYDTVGRTDLPTGDPKSLQESLKTFNSFDGNLTVYPGHGAPFLLRDAYQINFFLKRIR